MRAPGATLALCLAIPGSAAATPGPAEPPATPDLVVDVRRWPGCEEVDSAAVATGRPATCSIQAALDHLAAGADPTPGDGTIYVAVLDGGVSQVPEDCGARPPSIRGPRDPVREDLRIENRRPERLILAGCGGVTLGPDTPGRPGIEVRPGDGPVSVLGLDLAGGGASGVASGVEVQGGGGPVALVRVTVRGFRGHGVVLRGGDGEARDLELRSVQLFAGGDPRADGLQPDGLRVEADGSRHRVRILDSGFVGSSAANDAVLVRARGDAVVDLGVEATAFSSLAGHAVQVAAGDRSRALVTVRGCRLAEAVPELGNGGVSVGATAEGGVELVFEDNELRGLGRRRSNAGLLSLSADHGPFSARVSGNRFEDSPGRAAITALAEGGAPRFELEIESNRIEGLAREALYVDLRGELRAGRVVLRGNRIGGEAPVGSSGAAGVVFRARGTEKDVALVVEDNTIRNAGRDDRHATLGVEVEDRARAALRLRANDLRNAASDTGLELTLATEGEGAELCVELADGRAASRDAADARMAAAPGSRLSVVGLETARRAHGDRLTVTGAVVPTEGCP